MSEHIVSRRLYFLIFGALMVLTAITVYAANINLGSEKLNTVVALTIAVVKATLVILFFMHVRYSPRLTWVVIASGFLWLAIMIVLTLSDYLTRTRTALPGR
ncbi:MAG TPA: cytochrome C oxidase subunit IV family protein [Pyrinomonadaceae bacterium]|jgi:cytochrome c oxidase subunit 4